MHTNTYRCSVTPLNSELHCRLLRSRAPRCIVLRGGGPLYMMGPPMRVGLPGMERNPVAVAVGMGGVEERQGPSGILLNCKAACGCGVGVYVVGVGVRHGRGWVAWDGLYIQHIGTCSMHTTGKTYVS